MINEEGRKNNMSKQKDIGTRGEKRVADYLRNKGFSVTRLALAGAQDVGDLLIEKGDKIFIAEVKAGKQTTGWIPYFRAWSAEAVKEAGRYAALHGCQEVRALLILARYNAEPKAFFVFEPVNSAAHRFWFLEDFVEGE